MEPSLRRVGGYRKKKNRPSLNDVFYISTKNRKQFKFFCYCLIFFVFTVITANTDNRYIPPAKAQGLEILALIMLVFASYKIMRFKFDNKYLAFIFPVYIIYLFSIVARAKFDYNSIKYLIISTDFGMFTYLAPLAILLPRNLEFYKRLINVIFILGIGFFGYAVIYHTVVFDKEWFNLNSQGLVEVFFNTLAFPSGFVVLTLIYYSNKKRLLAFLVLSLSLFLLVVRARRANMFLCLSTLTASGIVYFIYTKKKAVVIFLGLFFVFSAAIFISNTDIGVFKFIKYRGKEDTRTGVEEWMKDDMNTTQWMIGKGINGTYYTPVIIDSDISDRYVIETGYLQIILKGGIISLGLMLLIFIPAVFKGLFQSKNILSLGAGINILIWIISLYPVIPTTFNVYYIMVWVSAGICYSKKIRNLSNAQIKEYLDTKETIWQILKN